MTAREEALAGAQSMSGDRVDSFDAEAVLETLPVSVVVLDAHGAPCQANAPARRLASVVHSDINQGLKNLVANSPLFIPGESDIEHKDCEDRYECHAEDGRALGVIRQWRVAGAAGNTSCTLRPIRAEDKAESAQASALDGKSTSERQSMIHAEKLATVGQLAAGMAHEINNPICYVQSNLGTLGDYLNKLFGLIELSEQLLRDSSVDAGERLQSFEQRKQADDYQLIAEDLPALLEESREGVERIRQIVQNLRDFSRMDPSENFRLFDIHRAIETTLEIVRSLSGGRVRFATYFQSLPLVECNPTELNQVFMNILVNASHAVDVDGAVEIHTSVLDGGNSISIRISDNGSGMDEATQARIFEPFFTTKEVGKGTGLGLSISYGIINKHGGRIGVESQVGQGTTFTITLPVRQEQSRLESS